MRAAAEFYAWALAREYRAWWERLTRELRQVFDLARTLGTRRPERVPAAAFILALLLPLAIGSELLLAVWLPVRVARRSWSVWHDTAPVAEAIARAACGGRSDW